MVGNWHRRSLDAARDHAQLPDLIRECLSGDGAFAESTSSIFLSSVIWDGQTINIVGGSGVSPELRLSSTELLDHCGSRNQLAAFVASRLFSPILQSDPSELEVERGRGPLIQDLLAQYRNAVSSTLAFQIVEQVRSNRDVAVFGKSASGKTVACVQSVRQLLDSGFLAFWVDLSEPECDVWDVAIGLLRLPRAKGTALYIDDVQAQPLELKRIALLIGFMRQAGSRLRVVSIAWESARKSVEACFPESYVLTAISDQTLSLMIQGRMGSAVSDVQRQQIMHIAGGDLVVGDLAIEFFITHKRLPQSADLGRSALSRLTHHQELQDKSLELIYTTAALSQFEIDIASTFVRAIDHDGHDALLKNKVLRTNGNYTSIGHRSIARLILPEVAQRLAASGTKAIAPNKIAITYLQQADARQLLNTLERLDLARLSRVENDQHGTKYLVQLWDTLMLLLRSLNRHAELDPTWSDDTGSAALAYRALSQFNYESAELTAANLTRRWAVDNDADLPRPVGAATNERKDFDEIARCMGEEESLGIIPEYAEKARDVDLERMHRTWVLGLLLGVEARKKQYDPERMRRLKAICTRQQLVNGSFYPSRVPWVTARVLIGLSEAGESIDSSRVVRDGCNWLLRASPGGPFEMGAWPSYTGTWNPTTGITAMCLNALIRCGVPVTGEPMSLASMYLESNRAEWSQPGKEIDAAFVIETFLFISPHWRGLTKELSALLYWARNPATWRDVVKDASVAKNESLKVPFIATSLVGIIWNIVRHELPLLLEDVATGFQGMSTAEWETFKHATFLIIRKIVELRKAIEGQINERISLIQQRPDLGEGPLRAKLDKLRNHAAECDALINRARNLEHTTTSAEYEQMRVALESDLESLGASVHGDSWKGIR